MRRQIQEDLQVNKSEQVWSGTGSQVNKPQQVWGRGCPPPLGIMAVRLSPSEQVSRDPKWSLGIPSVNIETDRYDRKHLPSPNFTGVW